MGNLAATATAFDGHQTACAFLSLSPFYFLLIFLTATSNRHF